MNLYTRTYAKLRRHSLWLVAVSAMFSALSASAVIRDGGVDPANLGQGGWIYIVSTATNKLGSGITSVTNENSLFAYLKSQNFNYVIVKAGTSNKLWTGSANVSIGSSSAQFTSNLVQKAHANGLKIFGSNRSWGQDIPGEAAVANYVYGLGADGYIHDAESEWESGNAWIGANGPTLAWQLCSTIRSNWPNKFMAHNPYDTVYLHSSFPFKEFGYWCDTVMPQVYHHAASEGNAIAAIHWSDWHYQKLYDSFASMAPSVINGQTIYWTNAIKPLALMRDVYNGTSGTTLHPDTDVRNFLDYMVADPNCVGGPYKGSDYFRSELHTSGQWAYMKASTIGDFPGVVNNIIMDDNQASRSGAWSHVTTIEATNNTVIFLGATVTDTNSFGTNYWTAASGTGSSEMEFTPTIVTPGDYNIFQWHPTRSDASTAAPFIVTYNGGTATNFVNQTTNAGSWSFVGKYPFAIGTDGSVRITDAVGAGKVPLVDGLKMVFVPPTSVPATPTLLTATAPSSTQVNLTWKDNATNETAYILARSTTNGGPYTTLASFNINTTNYSDTSVTPGTTYYYIVRATNYLGTSANSSQASATTPASAAPVITVPPQSISVVTNSNAPFSVTASGTAPLLYQWRFNGTNIALANASNYTRFNVQTSDVGSYTVVVSNGFGSVTSVVATLTVLVTPTVNVPPQSRTNISGTLATFNVTASGGNLAYQWKKNGAPLSNGGNVSGALTSTLSLSGVTQSDAATYTVTVTNAAGTATSSPATLTVLIPPSVATQPQSRSISVGTDTTFSVTANGTAPLNYQWRFNGGAIAGATATSYSITNVQTSDAGSYSVAITNAAGSVTSSSAILNVIGEGTPILTFTNSWNIQAGSRNYVTTGSTERGLALNRFTGHVLIVSRSSFYTNGVGIAVVDADTGNDIGTMSVTNITNTASLKLNKIAVAADGVIYGANVTTASGSSPFIIYRWASESADPIIAYSGAPDAGATARWGDSFAIKGSGTNTQIIVSSSTATSMLVFTTSNGTNFVPTKLNPSPAVALNDFWGGLWFGADDTFFVKSRTEAQLHKYSFNKGANSCTVNTNFLVDSNILAFSVDTNRNLLFGVADDNTSNHAGHELLAYDISNAAFPTVLTNFYFPAFGSGTNSANANFAGSVDSDETRIIGLDTQNGVVALKIITRYAPIISEDPTNNTAIAGQTVTLSVSALGDAPLSYRWKKNGATVTDLNALGVTSATLTITNVSQANEGSYTIDVTNAVGSVTSETAVLVVLYPPAISEHPTNQTGIAGTTIQFSVTATGANPLSYEWRRNGIPLDDGESVAGSTEPTLVLSAISQADAGTYSVVVTNVAGTVVSSNAVLTVTDPPVIVSDPDSTSIGAGSNVVFTAAATGTSITYQWRRNGSDLANSGRISGATSSSLTIAGAAQADAASYSLFISNSVGTATSSDAVLVVIDPPSINSAPGDRTANAGSSTVFNLTPSGTAPFAYRWMKNNTPLSDTTNIVGSTTASLTISSLLAADAGSYSVSITNSAGAVTTSPAVLTVIDPYIVSNPTNRTNIVGTAATFTVGAVGTSLTYQWTKDGTNVLEGANITGVTNTTLNVASVSTNDVGIYNVIVTGAGNSVTSAPASLTVIIPVSIEAQPSSQTNIVGSSAVFEVSASGTSPLTYQWKFNGSPIGNGLHVSGATTATLTVSTLTTADEGTYSVDITNPAGSTSSAPAELTVIAPPVISAQPTNLLVNLNSNATFQVNAFGHDLQYQWRFNGSPITDATNSVLTLLNAQTNDGGFYSVIITNIAGAVVSSNALLTVNIDTNPPTLKILAPLAAQRLLDVYNVTNFATLLKGTATDKRQIAQVLYSVNNGPYLVANGTTNWAAMITIKPGTNSITVKALNTAGYYSIPVTRTFYYVVFSPLTVNIVSPSLLQTGQVVNPYPNPLEVGKGYKLTAFVGAGTNTVFTNWSRVMGGTTNVLTNSPTLSFIMESNLVLNANFIDNPFVRASGVYYGLFYNSNSITHDSAGSVLVKVTPKLTYSGKVQVDGNAVSFGGKFSLPGTTITNIFRTKIAKSNLTVTLALNFTNFDDRVTGTVSDSTNWISDLLAYRMVWTTNALPDRFTNVYAVAIPGLTNAAVEPTGFGYGSATVTKAGKVVLAGALADGSRLSHATFISKDGEWPLYVPLYSQPRVYSYNSVLKTNAEYRGSLIGWLSFATNTPAGKTNLAPQGTLGWIKEGTNGVYPGGFAGLLTVKSSRHSAPPIGTRVLNFIDGRLTTSSGNLALPFENKFFLNTNNAVAMTLPILNNQRFSIVARNGIFSGTFNHPNNTNAVTKFFGIVLQDYNYGRGYFVGTNQTGSISVDPQ